MKKRNSKSILFGLSFITIGVLLLLSALDIVVGNVIYIAISAVLVLYGLSALFSRNFFMGLYAIAFGFRYSADFYKHILDFTQVGYWQLFLITSLVALGLQLIFGKKHRRINVEYDFDHDYDIPVGSEYNTMNDDYISIQTYLKETTRYIYSDNLERVDLETKLGSSSIFFQQRELTNDVNIYVDCKLGNMELFIPKEWSIVDSINTNLGSVEVHYNQANNVTGPYTVYIHGDVTMGNIEIHYI